MEQESIEWILIGRGQQDAEIKDMLAKHPLEHLTWIPWVPYEELVDQIALADVCLGIFGDSDKAARVVPNKVYQVISAGRPLITRTSPAMHELLPEPMDGLYLVPPEDPRALADAIRKFRLDYSRFTQRLLFSSLREQISTARVGREFCSKLLDNK